MPGSWRLCPETTLVIVTNHLETYETSEWVYNDPDIDHAKVVWASDMGPEKNRELLNYFRGRARLETADRGRPRDSKRTGRRALKPRSRADLPVSASEISRPARPATVFILMADLILEPPNDLL